MHGDAGLQVSPRVGHLNPDLQSGAVGVDSRTDYDDFPGHLVGAVGLIDRGIVADFE